MSFGLNFKNQNQTGATGYNQRDRCILHEYEWFMLHKLVCVVTTTHYGLRQTRWKRKFSLCFVTIGIHKIVLRTLSKFKLYRSMH